MTRTKLRSFAIHMAAVAFLAAPALASAAPPAGYCEVTVCNKIERWTLSPWTAIKDRMGKTCQSALLAEADAVEGKELSSNTRWYQGSSFNPTKASVTRVKSVNACTPEGPKPAIPK